MVASRLTQAIGLKNELLYQWTPRPDNLLEGDQQTAFLNSNALVSMLTGGNGSGKSASAAIKAARFVCYKQAPPRKNTPFWVISSTYEQSCGMGWGEKLEKMIPAAMIDRSAISWIDAKQNWPRAVPLRPWPNGNNWVLEFKSYEQGRKAMEARSIGGAWFSEQFPMVVFDEVFRGCREYMFRGAVMGECTPIDPKMAAELKARKDKKGTGWEWFSLNSQEALRAGHTQQEWFDSFFNSISSEMLATRMRGAFAGYEGVLFPGFRIGVHALPDRQFSVPPGCFHYRAIDWGSTAQHPFVCLWLARDGAGRWYVYDEYWSNNVADMDWHAKVIKERHPEWDSGDRYFYRTTYADPSSPDYLWRFGTLGIPCTNANNDVWPGIETLRTLLGDPKRHLLPRILINEDNCPHTVEQMQTVRTTLGSGKGLNPTIPVPTVLKNNDDAFDALRYGVHSVEMMNWATQKPISYGAAPNPNGKSPIKIERNR